MWTRERIRRVSRYRFLRQPISILMCLMYPHMETENILQACTNEYDLAVVGNGFRKSFRRPMRRWTLKETDRSQRSNSAGADRVSGEDREGCCQQVGSHCWTNMALKRAIFFVLYRSEGSMDL